MKQLRLVMIGDVDAGKSTILGRLLLDLGQITPAKIQELESSSARRGVPIEYSFLLDAFQAERDQAITLDLTRIWVRTATRDVVFVDAPGHHELIRNLLSGASEVDAAVLVVAADEGITPQTRRQVLFLRWFGFSSVLVVVNKLDLASDPAQRFAERRDEIETFLADAGLSPSAIIPLAARAGENIVTAQAFAPWWSGPTFLEAIEPFEHTEPDRFGPLRLLVQDVYRRGGSRIVVGRVDSGALRVGETLTFWPVQATAAVKAFKGYPEPPDEVVAGDPIALELDARVFVDRGAIASHLDDAPRIGHVVRGTIVWLSATPLHAGEAFRMRLGTREVPVTATHIEEVLDSETLAAHASHEVRNGDVATITLVAREAIAADAELPLSSVGRFVLLREGVVVAGGRVASVIGRDRHEGATNVKATRSSVSPDERAQRNTHRGGVFWLTGLPSAGKSTIAMRAQRVLFDRGYQVYVLDGDTLRTTLNADLGFSDEDRAENVRRTAAIAAVFADAGMVVITALISPFAADRERARGYYPDGFHEIYVACDLPTAEERDVKGLYRRARLGEIANFTGVSSPYERPEKPALSVDTTSESVDESVAAFVEYIIANT